MARILTVTLNPALDLTVRLANLHVGEVNRSEGLDVHAAGKGLNVAQVLADLGHQITVTGFLGDANPQAFEQLFSDRHFADEFVRVTGDTRSNIKVAEGGGRVTDLNGPGLEVDAQARSALRDRLARLAPQHEAVVVAGSLPRGVHLPWFVELLQMIKDLGVPLVLDTSGPALAAGLEVRPWLIKPNEEELAQACGSAVDTPEALARQALLLQRRGIEHVVVSQGGAGVSWFTAAGILRAIPPKVGVVSTVGAGDSLLAGMLHGLLEGLAPEATLRQATAIAAQAVGQVGFGITDRARLSELQQAVQLQTLAE